MAIVGQGITAYPQSDDALNENSKNPVQNKVVAGNIKELKGKDTVQDERIAAMEQVTTATTIGPVAIATFDASAANMPLKGLTANIGPVQDLHGYDHPWPEGGGKNLLKYPYETGTVTKNGVTFTVYNDGSIKVDTAGAAATANADLYFFSSTGSLPLSNGDYIFSSTYDGTLPSDGFYIHAKANASDASYLNISIGDEGLYTVSNGVFYTACIRVLSGRTINNVTVRPMLRLATEADATFEPYSNICPISGWTGCNILQYPENLLSINDIRTGRITSDGGFNIDTTTRCATLVFIPVAQNANYTIATNSGIQCIAVHYYKNDQTWLYRDAVSGQITAFTTPANCSYIRVMFAKDNTSASITPSDITTAILMSGNAYNITFPTEAGTVYGGTLDVVNKKLIVDRVGVKIKDITWTYVSTYARFQSAAPLPYAAKPAPSQYAPPDGLMCECYVVAGVSGLPDKKLGITNTGVIMLKDDNYTTQADLNAAVGENLIVYALASPIVYDLSDIPEITTLLDTNNIWADTGDVTVTYGAYLEAIKELVDKREMREEQVEGTVVNLNAEPNTRYICGEVTTLDITLPASGTCDILFTSGSTPTVLTVPSTVKWMHGFDPTALAADTIYELNITDGLGVVASWT